ncbi:MAG: Crp/Fnr family transcriptional regulator [Tissierellia bacterium]|nr:Crp/Fnr family transcriptional regulator [Tissierellia bacterium]
MTQGCITCGSVHELCTRNIPSFQGLPEDVQAQIVSQALHEDYEKGRVLFRLGDPCDSIYIIRQGKVKLSYIDAEGKEIIIDIMVDGELIGDNLFLEKREYDYDAVCISDVKICQITRRDYEEVLKNNPILALNLIYSMSGKLKDQEEKIRILSENDAKKRLAIYLLSRNRRTKKSDIKLSVEEIAASINLRPETISRKIKDLVDEGYLERIGKKRLSLSNIEGLKRMIDI